MDLLRHCVQIVLSLAVVAGGGTTVVRLVQPESTPRPRSDSARAESVAVQTVVPQTGVFPIVGYGTVRPKRQVKIVPQVSGALVYSHADLASGMIIAKGDLLFEVDPEVYEARVQQAEAEVRALEAGIARHDQETANLDARLAIEEQLLLIDERDYTTSRRLLDQQQVGTRRDLTAAYAEYLRQKDAVTDYKNRRATVAHLRRESLARLDASVASLLQVRHDLENTMIFCPFTAIVESVEAHQPQMVTAHLPIATLTDVETLEIPVTVNPSELRWLSRTLRPHALERDLGPQGPYAKISWSHSESGTEWRARLTRFEHIDEATRTARMIVEIRTADFSTGINPSSGAPRLPLLIGLYCRAELPTEPLVDALLIPRQAIHDDRWVYVFEPQANGAGQRRGRLGRREVTMLRRVDDLVLVDHRDCDTVQDNGLVAGDMLIVSHLDAPVVHMRIALQESPDPTHPLGQQPHLAVMSESCAGSGALESAITEGWLFAEDVGIVALGWPGCR